MFFTNCTDIKDGYVYSMDALTETRHECAWTAFARGCADVDDILVKSWAIEA